MIKNPKITHKLDDSKMKHIFNELEKLKKSYVIIGIQEGNKEIEGLLVSQYMFWNEFGTKYIPERPFMRNWFDSNLNQIKNFIKNLYTKVLDGKITANRALNLLGQYAQDGIRKSILNTTTPPNAPSTIKRKKSSHPLIDTGQALNSIHYKIGYGKIPIETGIV